MTTGAQGSRARQPQQSLAEQIAHHLYTDVMTVDWVPSDEADVFRLTFGSDEEPRYLKISLPGTNVVAREVLMLPVLLARGFPVLEFEHSTPDLPDAGTAFHVTREVQHVTGPELIATDPSACYRLATQLGKVVHKLEHLDAEAIPGSLRWSRNPEQCWRPQYRALIEDHRWPPAARRQASRILERLNTPPDAFGDWYGEMLIRPDGSFVMIDWTTAGAHWSCAQAATCMEGLSEWSEQHKREIVRHFLHGYAPDGLRPLELEQLRLWSMHGPLGWTMLQPPTEAAIRRAAAAAHQREISDDPADWL